MAVPWVPWEVAAPVGAVLAAGAAATARPASPRGTRRHAAAALHPWLREGALVAALYAVWQAAGALSLMQTRDAAARGRWIWHVERLVHLPSELAAQQAVMAHPLVVRAANAYYAFVHVPALVIFLIWLFARHRDRYPPVRTVLALASGACLLVQLVPVAPPRLLAATGMVDTGAVFGPSVYGGSGASGIDQLSAMPSLHVAWSIVVAAGIIWAASGRWRWLALAHPVLTVWAVTVTGNHYLLDGIAAAAIVALAAATRRAVTGLALARPVRPARRAAAHP